MPVVVAEFLLLSVQMRGPSGGGSPHFAGGRQLKRTQANHGSPAAFRATWVVWVGRLGRVFAIDELEARMMVVFRR